jgi:antirestriction protein ArdC
MTSGYAMEELVAALGAAFTGGHLNLACHPRTDHAPYIASRLRVLCDDPRAILTAASKAQAAADYLINLAEPAATDRSSLTSAAEVHELEFAA